MAGIKDAATAPTAQTFSFVHLLIFNILRDLSNPLMRCFMQKTLSALLARGANNRSKVNTLVFPVPRGPWPPSSFVGIKNQCLFPLNAIRMLIIGITNCFVFV